MDVQAMLAVGALCALLWAWLSIPVSQGLSDAGDAGLSGLAILVGFASLVIGTVCAILAAGWPS
jgi:hypothetical protein